MISTVRRSIPVLLLLAGLAGTAVAADKSIAERTSGMTQLDGFIPIHLDEPAGKIYLDLSRFGTELLYVVSLPAGVGSNPIGLDRGQLGDSHVVVFERVGPRVLMVARNYRYRAITDNPAERRAVEDSFARSVLWGFQVEAAEAGRVLVDATSFFLRDAHDVAGTLRRTRQGQYRFDASRSALYLSRTKAFPKNTEVEATITLATDGDPGPLVSQVTPAPDAVTVRQHHSFVELPELGGYTPRRPDPRIGAFGLQFHDYASPITEPIERRYISRHRLQKRDPSAAISDPIEPIVYYVDNGAPEPIRSALVDGASWWNQAFEAAGFRNGFQVRVLPEDADPMDLRYHVIHWVHRSTRGWSYGGSVVDPRTGQILKGNVTLGSLRVRQDHMLATGLVGTTASLDGSRGGGDLGDGVCDAGTIGDADYLAAMDPSVDAAGMSLARIRQLSAHEVGHTLGFAHNFAASTYGGRASVMDYPAPLVKITDGKIDLSDAYTTGIGVYDRWAVRYAYAQFAPGVAERESLDAVAEEGVRAGYLYLSDEDARPAGAAHPLANLWDNGPDPVEGLRHALRVREIGLARFGVGNISIGTPLSQLEAQLLPLYFHHRYQLQAAVKTIGGAYYSYAVRAAAGPSPPLVQEVVPAAKQRDALAAVLDAIQPRALTLPASVLAVIPPRASGFGGPNTELFPGRTDPTFDPVGAATIAADAAIALLLNPQRAARLVDFHARDSANLDFGEVVTALVNQTWVAGAPADAMQRVIHRATGAVAVSRLMELAGNAEASPLVRAEAEQALRDLGAAIKAGRAGAGMGRAQANATRDAIARFLARPEETTRRGTPLPVPPGDPIGVR
jgi:hypothetical protein